jgi:hypothetical protein
MSLFKNLLKSIKQAKRIERNEEKPARVTAFLGIEKASEIRKLPSSEARDYATKAMVDMVNNTLTIELGTEDFITVPFLTFYSDEPEFSKVSLSDNGRAVTFGNYRTTVAAIVNEWSLIQAGKKSSKGSGIVPAKSV